MGSPNQHNSKIHPEKGEIHLKFLWFPCKLCNIVLIIMIIKYLKKNIVNILELANPRTSIPPNFVRVIPDRTELPILMTAFFALSTLSFLAYFAKYLTMWLQNSTLIPTAITKFVKETALRVMLHQYMNAPTFRDGYGIFFAFNFST